MGVLSKSREWLSNESIVRSALGFTVTGLGIIALGVMSAIALHFADPDGRPEAARLVFASIVPLLGTWVGSVLAYYFSSQNLRAGSETALAAVTAMGGLSPETPVQKVMISLDHIRPVQLVESDDKAKELVLGVLYRSMTDAHQSRLPILQRGLTISALYVIHEGDIEKYAGSLSPAVAPGALTQPLSDLLSSGAARFADLTSFAVVSELATIADARAALKAKADAKDVFVTTGGTRTGAVLGWLTNSQLAKTE